MKKILYILCLISFFGCKYEDKVDANVEKKKQMKNIAYHGVQPQLSQTIDAFETLVVNAETFQGNTNSQNLQNTKQAFIQALLKWKACEIFEMGALKSQFLYSSINFWPANTTLIEEKIQNATTIDQAYIASLGSPLRSISAIEYLLYDQPETETLNTFQANNMRTAYLVEACKYLKVRLLTIYEAWKTYAPTFVEPNTENILQDGQNIALNTIVQQLENIKNLKLEPSIKLNSPENRVRTLEAHRSRQSLQIIQQNFSQIKMMLLGSYENGTGYGFDDYLNTINSGYLNNKMSQLLQQVENNINALANQPLEESVVHQHDKIVNLSKSITELLKFLKKDVQSALNAVLTISDTDGD